MEDILLAPYRQGITPGCAIAVIKDREVINVATAGYADLEEGIPISSDTNFRLASVSKQFTAVSILILIQKDLLNLDDTLTVLFPEFPDYARDITILHLLTHTSGLQDYYIDLPSEYASRQIYDEDVLKILKQKNRLDSVSGTKYFYNDGAYCLLKLIIEKVSKQDFEDFLKENIFMPLGMNATVPNNEGITAILDRAYGYSFEEEKWIRTDQRQTSTTMGDGGIYSSIKDLALWSEIIHGNKILSPKMKALMLTKHVLTDEGPGVYYGFGLFLKERDSALIAYHGGSTIGFEIGIYYDLVEKLTFIFLSNGTGEQGSVKVTQLAEEYLVARMAH